MWLITASMHLPPGKWNFLACTQKARSCLWRTMSETEAISYVFLVSLCFWHFSGLKEVMSQRYCCFKSILCRSHYLMSLPIQEILPQSIAKNHASSDDIHWFFWWFFQAAKHWLNLKMLGQLFQVSIHFPIHAIRYNRRQETVSMPKYGPLSLEFNTCEKGLWLGCRNFTQCFRVQFVFWLYYPWKFVCINHYTLIAWYYCYLIISWKQVRDGEDLFSSFSWKRKFNDKKNCNQNGNPETGRLPWSLHFWYALWFFTGWSFPFSSLC